MPIRGTKGKVTNPSGIGGFRKGQSGNPKGRPHAVKSLQDLAQLHTLDAVQTLIEIMKDHMERPSARVSAACEILNRGWGRPIQSVELTREDQEMEKMDDLEERKEYFLQLGLGEFSEKINKGGK